jgi:hypothetical protein
LRYACVFLLGQSFSRDHDGIAMKLGIEIRETMVRQEVQSRLPVHHAMRLGGGNPHLVEWLVRTHPLEAVGMHQDIGDPRCFEQHASLGDDDKKRAHGLNNSKETK